MASLVVPGAGDTIATSRPERALSRLLFPCAARVNEKKTIGWREAGCMAVLSGASWRLQRGLRGALLSARSVVECTRRVRGSVEHHADPLADKLPAGRIPADMRRELPHQPLGARDHRGRNLRERVRVRA